MQFDFIEYWEQVSVAGSDRQSASSSIKDFLLRHAILIGVLLFVVGRSTLSFSGFCTKSSTWYSDQQMIDAAVAHEMKRQHSLARSLSRNIPRDFPVSDWKPGDPNPVQLYDSVAQFHEINPDCCDLTRLNNAEWNENKITRSVDGHLFDIFEIGLYGLAINKVVVYYKKYKTGYYSFTKARIYMDSCLRVRDWSGSSRGYSSLRGVD